MVGTRIWRTVEAELERPRTEAQESLAQGLVGCLTRNTHSFSLSLGSRSEQAVLEGSTSFLLSPPQLQSPSQTSASNLSPCKWLSVSEGQSSLLQYEAVVSETVLSKNHVTCDENSLCARPWLVRDLWRVSHLTLICAQVYCVSYTSCF